MTSAPLYHAHLDAADGDVTYGVITIARGQSNAGNLFSGTFNVDAIVHALVLPCPQSTVLDRTDHLEPGDGGGASEGRAVSGTSSRNTRCLRVRQSTSDTLRGVLSVKGPIRTR